MLSRMLPRALTALSHQTPPPRLSNRTLATLSRPRVAVPVQVRAASHANNLTRWLSTKSAADEAIEEITELYATARDEFEIAQEETEKQTVYAEDDRKAAREELDKVLEAFHKITQGADTDLAEEVKRRIGQRIRELDSAVKAMEELAMNQD